MWPGFAMPKTPPPGWGSVPQTITITAPSMSMPNINGDIYLEPVKLVVDKCICDIMVLMAVGCKCGQFQREQSKQ